MESKEFLCLFQQQQLLFMLILCSCEFCVRNLFTIISFKVTLYLNFKWTSCAHHFNIVRTNKQTNERTTIVYIYSVYSVAQWSGIRFD